MRIATFLFRWASLLSLISAVGCGHSDTPPEALWRFVGGNTLVLQTNAPVLASALRLPESAAIRPLLLSNTAVLWCKLISPRNPPPSAVASALQLLPDLFDGLSLGETYLSKAGKREFVLALPVDSNRAQVWEKAWTNLFNTLRPGDQHAGVLYENGWIIALSNDRTLTVREARKQMAVIPANVGNILRLETGGPLPPSTLSLVVRDGLVQADLRLITKNPLPDQAAPWETPDIIRSPLIQLTAAREIQPWLKTLPFFDKLPPGAIPSQWFVWCQASPTNRTYFDGFRTYSSVRTQQPTELLVAGAKLLEDGLAPTNSRGNLPTQIIHSTNDVGFNIRGFPYVLPKFYPLKEGDRDYVTMGMFPPMVSTNPMSPQIRQPMSQSNLVYYDWESTGRSAAHWNAISQIYELAHNRLPHQGAGSAWLLAASASVPFSATEGLITGRHELTFHRRSPLGLTSIEMALIATWLDWDQLNIRGVRPVKPTK